jgi:hypothetical protein
MNHRTQTAASSIVGTALLLAVTAACSSDNSPSATPPSPRGQAAATQPSPTHSVDDTSGGGSPTRPQEDEMRIQITIGDDSLQGTLRDSAASRDLLAQLPLTLTLTDFGSVEKVGELPSPLSTAGEPLGADPNVGDIGYYSPWNNFVLYYGDQTYHDGIILLGTVDEGIDTLQQREGDVAVTIQPIE